MKKYFLSILALILGINTLFSSAFNSIPDTLHHLYGAIAGKYGITMNIFIRGDQVHGSMYYNRVGQYIYLKGSIDNTGHMQLEGSLASGQKTDFFDGIYNGKVYQGKWHTLGNNRVLNFSLKRTNNHWVLLKRKIWQINDSVKKDGGWVHFKIIVNTNLPKAYPIPKAGKKISEAINEELNESFYLSSYQDFKQNALMQFNDWKEGVQEAESDSYTTLSDLDAYDSASIYVSDVYKLFLTVETEDFEKDPELNEIYNVTYDVYDLYTGELISIDDLFSSSDLALKKVIIPALEKNFKMDYQENVTDYISLDEIELPDYFRFTGGGVEFVYLPESLGGATRVPYVFTVPYSELLSYLKPEFKRRFER